MIILNILYKDTHIYMRLILEVEISPKFILKHGIQGSY